MKKIKLHIYRFLYKWVIPITVTILLIASLLWDRNIPIGSGMFYMFLMLYFLFKKLKVHNSNNIINGALKLDVKVIELIENSHHYLCIVSAFFLIGKNRIQSIKKALDNGAEVIVIVNSDSLLNIETVEELKKIQNMGCKVYHNPNLHSKIYLNEKSVITTSLNLHKGSISNSLEVGSQTDSVDKLKIIENIIKEEYIKNDNTLPFTGKIVSGFCIRTKSKIPLNPKIPISYTEWYRTNDRNGKYCHTCGKASDTQVRAPMCVGLNCEKKALA